MTKWIMVCGLLLTSTVVGVRAEDGWIAEAQAFFEQYQYLERSFDPDLASLYADNAVIWVTRIYSNNVVRQLKIPGDVYRLSLRDSMTEAAKHGDYNEFTDVRFTPVATGVRIRATRHNVWRDYLSAYEALIEPDAAGDWHIVEERFETRVPHPATE